MPFAVCTGYGIIKSAKDFELEPVLGKKAMDESNLLFEISRRLNSDLDVNRVLSEVLHLTSKCIGADNGSVIILDERGAVVHKILTRRDMNPEKAKFVLYEVLSQGLAGWVVDHRRKHRWRPPNFNHPICRTMGADVRYVANSILSRGDCQDTHGTHPMSSNSRCSPSSLRISVTS